MTEIVTALAAFSASAFLWLMLLTCIGCADGEMSDDVAK
jgi:hypothetical protein